MNIIILRHKGAVEWLNAKGINGPVYPHASRELIDSFPKNAVVYGVLPMDLIAHVLSRGLRFIWVKVDFRPEDRGKDLSFEEMCERSQLVEVRSLELQKV